MPIELLYSLEPHHGSFKLFRTWAAHVPRSPLLRVFDKNGVLMLNARYATARHAGTCASTQDLGPRTRGSFQLPLRCSRPRPGWMRSVCRRTAHPRTCSCLDTTSW